MVVLKLQPKRKERLGDQLYGQILEQIVGGTLKEGDRLPSEKALCQMFEVSRPVVREAIMRLQADGLVMAKQGSGTYVQKRPPQGLVALAGASDVAGMLRCYEVRIPIESEAAALAARRRTPDQLAAIRAAYDAVSDAMHASGNAGPADFAFHRAIAEASGNDLFVSILDMLHGVVENQMTVALGITRQGSPDRAERVLDEHRRILDAIVSGDGDAAMLAMRYHITRARQRVTDHQLDP